jgi:NEDD4-binding protein 2
VEKKLIVMRGLPWTGKSYRAKELAGEAGVIYSTDEYWYKINFPDRPDEYSFNPRLLGEAHKWNQLRAQRAVEESHPLIIIDNTNTTASEAKPYVEYAHWQDYQISIEEPTSDRWKEISALLNDKKANKKELKAWATELSEGSKETHSVPAWAIERMIWRWETGLTVERILASNTL